MLGELAMVGAGVAGSYLTNQMNSAQAASNRAFQSEMSNTAHQREVEDLRKAGLNPILSAYGSGASTPGGAQAQMESPVEGAVKGASTAMQYRQMQKDFEQKDAQIGNINAQTANVSADTKNKAAQGKLFAAQAAASVKDAQYKSAATEQILKTLPEALKKAKAEGDFAELNQIMGVINSGASSAGQLMNIIPGIKQLLPAIKDMKGPQGPSGLHFNP